MFAAACAAFVGGAAIGGLCTLHLHNRAAWIAAAWLALGTALLARARDAEPAAVDG